METLETYKTGDKVLIRVESEFTCVGCCFLDEKTEKCLAPRELPPCNDREHNYQYHEQTVIAETDRKV